MQPVSIGFFCVAVLVLHRVGLPKTGGALQRNTICASPELHHVTVARHPQPVADHPHAPGDQQLAPALGAGVIVAAGMIQMPFGGAQIFSPLLLQIGQCPLTAAEGKVLDTGHLQVVVRRVHQCPP